MTREFITLISPNKIPFPAQWVGDARTKTKKLGVFSPPLVKGSIVQDLEVSADTYPLNFFFAGPSAALAARLFWSEADANGKWIIIHPTLGTLKLQLVTVTDDIQPVNDVARRVFVTEWIEPIEDGALAGLSFLLAVLDASVLVADASAADAFVENIKQATFGEVQALQNAVGVVVASVKNALSTSSRDSVIPTEQVEIESGIDALLLETPINGAALAASIQKYIQLPVLGMTAVDEGFSQYTNMITANATTGPGEPTTEGLNEVASQELTLVACVSALASISAINSLSTRAEAIGFAEQIIAAFKAITAALDASQTLFAGIRIDNQYFSQSKSYTDLAILVSRAAQYLLTASLDLAVEKRFTLDQERSPLFITVQEYGTLGVDDVNYHKFVDSNNLKGDEILVIPAGREVVVYV